MLVAGTDGYAHIFACPVAESECKYVNALSRVSMLGGIKAAVNTALSANPLLVLSQPAAEPSNVLNSWVVYNILADWSDTHKIGEVFSSASFPWLVSMQDVSAAFLGDNTSVAVTLIDQTDNTLYVIRGKGL